MHINHRRGDTRDFVYRKGEYGNTAHRGLSKGPDDSYKPFKKMLNRQFRRKSSKRLSSRFTKPVRLVRWYY